MDGHVLETDDMMQNVSSNSFNPRRRFGAQLAAMLFAAPLFVSCAAETTDGHGHQHDPDHAHGPRPAVVAADNGIINCPSPDGLPFQTETWWFEDDRSAQAAIDRKSEDTHATLPHHTVVDYIGNPGDTQTFSGQMVYGLTFLQTLGPEPADGLPEEFVSLWTQVDGTWTQLGRTRTDEIGRWEITLASEEAFGVGIHRLYAVAEGDQSCQMIVASVLPQGTHVVVTDIDETMTISNGEIADEIEDPANRPKLNVGAKELTLTYEEKGYYMMYLTARSYHLQNLSRAWLTEQGLAFGHLETAYKVVEDEAAVEYKGGFIKRLKEDLGFNVFAGYGNADSDADGYEHGGIPKDRIFIIGKLAGYNGTVPIDERAVVDGEEAYSYRAHLDTFVANEVPDADQPF